MEGGRKAAPGSGNRGAGAEVRGRTGAPANGRGALMSVSLEVEDGDAACCSGMPCVPKIWCFGSPLPGSELGTTLMSVPCTDLACDTNESADCKHLRQSTQEKCLDL